MLSRYEAGSGLDIRWVFLRIGGPTIAGWRCCLVCLSVFLLIFFCDSMHVKF
jgi:hypothetical protein